MTVQVADRLSQLYVGNGINTRFDFTFRVFDQEDETGVAVRIKIGNDFEFLDESKYAVTINQDNLGGYITFTEAPDNKTFFYIAGKTPVDQLLDITNYDNFYPDAIERALDKLTAILQEWKHLVDFETQGRILADLQYDQLSLLRDQELKAYIDGLIAGANGEPIIGVQFLTHVNSISDLDSLLKWDGRTVFVKSYYQPILGLNTPYLGGGTREYKSEYADINNGGTIINGWVLVNPKWTFEEWGAKGFDPNFDDSVPIQNAFNYVKDKTNAKLSSEQVNVTYHIAHPLTLSGTEEYWPTNNLLNIDFSGTKLVPTANNITVLVVNRHHTKITRPYITNALGKSNVDGVLFGSITPDIKGGTCFSTLEYYTCEFLRTGFIAQPTRTDSNGGAAGAYYNEIISPVMVHTQIGFHFAGNDLALNNQNTRYNMFNPRQIGGNYMFKLECVETLKCFGGSAEFVGRETGEGCVFYVPQKYPGNTFNNNNNAFYGFTAEACNRLYENYASELSLFDVKNISPAKQSISGVSGGIVTEVVGKIQIQSDDPNLEPAVSVRSSIHNKQLYMRIDHDGNCQIWGDTTISIPQNLELFGNGLGCGYVNATQRLFTPNVTSKTSDLALASNNGDYGSFSINNNPNYSMIWNAAQNDTVFGGAPRVRPADDGIMGLGSASNRWSAVYASTGSIQTSDQRLKQQFRSSNDAERAAALEIKSSISWYKFNESVELKGDEARWHIGVKAQQVIQILEKHGLNWKQYGFVCHDKWESSPDVVVTFSPEILNDNGDVIAPAVTKVVKGVEAGDRYAIRYDELAMFILSAI
ncbi:TPA: tail fiber domain-containing protein [Acinetobacter baumannii]